MWERYRIVTFQEFLACHESRVEYWSMRRELIPGLLAARPNPAHYALAKLEQTGQLRCVITQNIDGLHQSAGSQRVIELHGTNMTASCLNCHSQWPIAEIQQRLEAGDLDPHCTACHGLIKPDTVSFGQAMPVASMEDAYQEATACDLLLMIGSSPWKFNPPINSLWWLIKEVPNSIFINRTATSYDHLAAVGLAGNAGRVLATLAE